MYTSQFFREARPDVLRDLIEAHPFATLISHAAAGFSATHLPLMLLPDPDQSGRLVGHFARNNPQWRNTSEGSEVLAVFNGPHGYVSPRAYAVEPDVPTWNYVAAHVRGTWRIEPDHQCVFRHLEAAITRFERQRGGPSWRLDSLTPELIEGLYRGIVAFEIRITRIDCAFKLSQDKAEADRRAVVTDLETLEDAGARQTAALMRQYYGY